MGFLSKLIKFIFKLERKLLKSFLPEEAETGVRLEKSGTDHNIPVVYGIRRVPAIKVFKQTSDSDAGSKNENLWIVCVFCEGEVDEIEEIFFNDISENVKPSEFLNIFRFTGTDAQVANPELISEFPVQWTSAHKLSGICYAVIQLIQNKDNDVWQGEPTITARIRGKKVLDVRTDTTAYSTNPSLCIYDYLINSRYGKTVATDRIITQSFKDEADLSETQEEYTETETTFVLEPPDFRTFETFTSIVVKQKDLFTCNVVLDTSATVLSNINILLSGIRGIMPSSAGKLRLQIENAGSSVFSFNDDNIVGEITSGSAGKNNRFNRVIVRFSNELKKFEADEVIFPAPGSALETTWLTEDNTVVLEKSFTFATITNTAEALQMAEVVARRSREDLTASFKALPEAFALEPGDIIDITNDTRGWIAKPFRIVSIGQDYDGLIDLQFIEHQNSIYPWAVTDTTEDIPDTFLTSPQDILTTVGLTFVALIDDSDLQFEITWTDPLNSMVTQHRFEVFETSGPPVLIQEGVVTDNKVQFSDFVAGTYQIKVYAKNASFEADPALLNLSLILPIIPDSITVTPGIFDITAVPQLSGATIGDQFEFALDTTSPILGLGKSIVFASLDPNTEHTVFARTVNALGRSAFASQVVTTLSSDVIVVLIESEWQDQLDQIPRIWDELVSDIGQIFGDGLIDADGIVNRDKIKEETTLRTESIAETDATLAEAQVELDTLNDTTIPVLNARLFDAEQDLIVAEADIVTLNTVTIPAITADINTINTVTIPAITADIDTINNVTIPAITADITDLEDKFPIGTTDISDNAISTPKLQANSVTAAKIVALTITASEIAALTITGAKIAALTITAANIAALTISADKIVALTITGDKIAALTISGDKIIANTISAAKIVANTITAAEIAADTISVNEMAANSIGTSELIATAVTANEIAANTIVAGNIAALTITAAEISANAITASKILAGAILTDKLGANQVTAAKIAALTITANEIAALTITGAKIQGTTITGDKIVANTLTATQIDVDNLFAEDITATGTIDGAIVIGAVVRTKDTGGGEFGTKVQMEDGELWAGPGAIGAAGTEWKITSGIITALSAVFSNTSAVGPRVDIVSPNATALRVNNEITMTGEAFAKRDSAGTTDDISVIINDLSAAILALQP